MTLASCPDFDIQYKRQFSMFRSICYKFTIVGASDYKRLLYIQCFGGLNPLSGEP